MTKEQWEKTQKKCDENCHCDYCKILKPFKSCKNPMCGNIIERYQESWNRNFCSEDCEKWYKHVKLVNETIVNGTKRKKKYPTTYNHKTLDVVLTID